MKKIIFKLGLSVLILNLWLPFHSKAIHLPPIDGVYYYIQVDKMETPAGYLSVDPTDNQQVVLDDAKGEYALWKFIVSTTTSEYYIVNYMTDYALAFEIPATTDEDAIIHPEGSLALWYSLFDEDLEPNVFVTSDMSQTHYLTCDDDGNVKISANTTTLIPLTFRLERPKLLPTNHYYRIRVDTLGTPLTAPLGYLSADTLKATCDSLTIDKAITDLSLWVFELDSIVKDTTLYKITNHEKGIILAFDVPGVDTIASVTNTGLLNQWRIPFYEDEHPTGTLMVQDTVTKINYYLAVNPYNEVMLVKDPPASNTRILSFALADSFQYEYPFDSTQVYKIKYKQGPLATLYPDFYAGVNVDGSDMFLDSVYTHIPDGQYVVNHKNTRGLLNRTLNENVHTIDTLFYVIDTVTGLWVQDWYHTTAGDTVEVTPIDYGSLDKHNPHLGYMYVPPYLLIDSCHYLTCTLPDSLAGRLLGEDTIVMLLAEGDTAYYLLEEAGMLPGAQMISDIASLHKSLYRLRSTADTTMYLSSNPLSQLSNNDAGLYLLKESIIPGDYYLVLYTSPTSVQKLTVDADTKQLYHTSITTPEYTLFNVVQAERPSFKEPDPYTYLTDFPDDKGKGFYELRIGTEQEDQKWLTKNIYDYAVLGKEGESMLRAGSFTPYDLLLWVDTARGPLSQPDKPSFYIVYDVDTLEAGPANSYIMGYFLHIMDSTNILSTVEVDGNSYFRLNYVHVRRTPTHILRLSSDIDSEPEINEFRFYFQETNETDKNGNPYYHLVTEAGYGDGGRTPIRGYLAQKGDTLFVGPYEMAKKIQLSSSTIAIVANEVVAAPPLPPAPEAVNNDIAIIGGTGAIDVLNAAGQPLSVYNILGRLVTQRTLATDFETIAVARGILIVKAGPITRKVVVQ